MFKPLAGAIQGVAKDLAEDGRELWRLRNAYQRTLRSHLNFRWLGGTVVLIDFSYAYVEFNLRSGVRYGPSGPGWNLGFRV